MIDGALSDSTPFVITLSAVVTMVSVAFGGGMVWARISHRVSDEAAARAAADDLARAHVEAVRSALAHALEAAKASAASQLESLQRDVARISRESSEAVARVSRESSDAYALAHNRYHQLSTTVNDHALRVSLLERAAGYDGRGQVTPPPVSPTSGRRGGGG